MVPQKRMRKYKRLSRFCALFHIFTLNFDKSGIAVIFFPWPTVFSDPGSHFETLVIVVNFSIFWAGGARWCSGAVLGMPTSLGEHAAVIILGRISSSLEHFIAHVMHRASP